MSHGKRLLGQEYDPRFNMVYPFEQEMLDYNNATPKASGSEGNAATDLSPKDQGAVLSRKYDLAAIQASRTAYFRKVPRRIPVDLPVVLTEVVSVVNKSAGAGADDHLQADQSAAFTVTTDYAGSGQAQLSPRSSANGSASVQIALAPKLKRFPRVVSAMQYDMFFNGDFTEADIKTKITANLAGSPSVTSWPNFIEVSDTLISTGQQASVAAKADAEAYISASKASDNTTTALSASSAHGGGTSQEVSVTNTIIQLPPSIHAALAISPNTDTADADAEAKAPRAALTFNAGTIVAALTTNTFSKSKTVTASVTPTTVPATSVTTVPTSGLYLYDWSVDVNVGYGDSFVSALVIDMTVFA
jgi:hypothetical protein